MLSDSSSGTQRNLPEFSDKDLQDALLRCMKLIGALTLVAIPIVWALWGWQSAILLVVGAGVAALSLWEWRSLVTNVAVMFEENPAAQPRPMARVLIRFFLRFALAAAALYVSLKCLHGSVYALITGLALAMLAVTFQALSLLRKWR
jgi:hypothetical protein